MAKKTKPAGCDQREKSEENILKSNYTPYGLVDHRPNGLCLAAQQAAFINALEVGTVNTIEAQALGIMSPSSCICDLKRKGAYIGVEYKDITVDGYTHRGVAHYSLAGWLATESQEDTVDV